MRAGTVILSTWCVLNIIPAAYIVFTIIVLGKPHPILAARWTPDEIAAIDPQMLAFINSIGVFANGLTLALALLGLATILCAPLSKSRWAFWALLGALGTAALAGLAGDIISGAGHYDASIGSFAILALGFGCVAVAKIRTQN